MICPLVLHSSEIISPHIPAILPLYPAKLLWDFFGSIPTSILKIFIHHDIPTRSPFIFKIFPWFPHQILTRSPPDGYGSKPCTPGGYPISMNIIVFIGMFTYPILMVIGINPWPDVLGPRTFGLGPSLPVAPVSCWAPSARPLRICWRGMWRSAAKRSPGDPGTRNFLYV